MTITPKNNLDRIDKSDRLVKDYLTDESLEYVRKLRLSLSFSSVVS